MAEDDSEAATLLAFIDTQAKRAKKSGVDDVPLLKLQRAAAALAELGNVDPPEGAGAVFVAAWRRTEHCHHFWGPTVGSERFCTKCQVPQSAVADDEPPTSGRRRS
ncbi:MAG: hypothetical protein ACRDY1_01765 [Acidimicrobiales bacterium]